MGSAPVFRQRSWATPPPPSSSSRPAFHNKAHQSSGQTTSKTADVAVTRGHCYVCNAKLSLFTKKRTCQECQQTVCFTCLDKCSTFNGSHSSGLNVSSSKNHSVCKRCRLLYHIPHEADVLMQMNVRELRTILNILKIPSDMCFEKKDLVDLVLQFGNIDTNFARDDQGHLHSSRNEINVRSGFQENGQGPQVRSELPACIQSNSDTDETNEKRRYAELDVGALTGDGEHASSSSLEISSDSSRVSATALESEVENDSIFEPGSVTLSRLDGNAELVLEGQTSAELKDDDASSLPQSHWLGLRDIPSEEAISQLTIIQLKGILLRNSVDYKGCCEKWELVDRVKRLWTAQPTEVEVIPETDLCKICMDAHVDCVLLECGHMATCTKCGRTMNECPICRQYVVRVVHIFKA